MKDFNFTLRDVLFYVIPGFLTITLIQLLVKNSNIQVYANDLLNFSLIIFLSYLLGFIIYTTIPSSIRKYLYNKKRNFISPFFYLILIIKLFKKEKKDVMFINNTYFCNEIKTNLISKIESDLNLSKKEIYKERAQIFKLCLSFVENYSNSTALVQPKRDYDLGNFFATISLPLIFFEIYLINILSLSICIKTLLWIIIPYLSFNYIVTKYHIYRCSWIHGIYRIYYITEKT